MSNSFVESRHDFTELELNVLLMLAKRSGFSDSGQVVIRFNELEEITGRRQEAKQIGKALTGLQRKLFQYPEKDRWISVQLCGGVQMRPGRAVVNLDPLVLPLFSDLDQNFTSYALESVMRLSGRYSKRFYLMACRWKSTEMMILKVSDLRQRLKLSDGYADFGNIRQRILSPALREINEKTEIDCQLIDTWKEGRKVAGMKFLVRSEGPDLMKEKNPHLVGSLLEHGFSDYQVSKVFEGLRPGEISQVLNTGQQNKSRGLVAGNMGSYLFGIFVRKGVDFGKAEQNSNAQSHTG